MILKYDIGSAELARERSQTARHNEDLHNVLYEYCFVLVMERWTGGWTGWSWRSGLGAWERQALARRTPSPECLCSRWKRTPEFKGQGQRGDRGASLSLSLCKCVCRATTLSGSSRMLMDVQGCLISSSHLLFGESSSSQSSSFRWGDGQTGCCCRDGGEEVLHHLQSLRPSGITDRQTASG